MASYSGLGLYAISFNSTKSGSATLQAYLNTTLVGTGEYSLTVLPAALSPASCVLFGVNGTATAGELQFAYLQMKDAFGNNASYSNVSIQLHVTQGNTVVVGTIVACTMGLCRFTYPSYLFSFFLFLIGLLL